MCPVKWIEDNLIFTAVSCPALKGKTLKGHLLPFQRDVLKSALIDKKNIFMGFSRKISKSMLYSWIFVYYLENSEGMALVNMASTFGQSNIVFRLIEDQIVCNPRISEKDYKIRREWLENTKRHNRLDKIFSKASSNLGMLNVSGVIADELGAMQSRANLDTILSGMSMAQDRPRLYFATNPPELLSHWSIEYVRSLKDDKDWKFYNFSAPLKGDVFSEKAKCAANPFYAHYKKTKAPLFKSTADFIDKEAEKAKKSGENLLSYKRLQLGQTISSKGYEWVSPADIQIAPLSILKNKKLRAVLGFDLALSRDFCSCVLCLFDEKTEDIYCRPFLHLANLSNRIPTQRVIFERWGAQGFITIQNRASISRALFVSDIKSVLSEHKIKIEASVWDRNLSEGWRDEFQPEVLCKGTGAELTHAIRFIEARSKDKKLHFIGENPALLTMFESAYCSPKSKSFVLLDRQDTTFSIDGAVCCVLATKFFVENRRQKFYGFAV